MLQALAAYTVDEVFAIGDELGLLHELVHKTPADGSTVIICIGLDLPIPIDGVGRLSYKEQISCGREDSFDIIYNS